MDDWELLDGKKGTSDGLDEQAAGIKSRVDSIGTGLQAGPRTGGGARRSYSGSCLFGVLCEYTHSNRIVV